MYNQITIKNFTFLMSISSINFDDKKFNKVTFVTKIKEYLI